MILRYAKGACLTAHFGVTERRIQKNSPWVTEIGGEFSAILVGPIARKQDMTAYAIFDVEIYDMKRYGEYMSKVQPALEAAGGRYLARGGEHKVYEGDWLPRRLVLVEFPSVADMESFYYGSVYGEFKSLRDDCSSGRLVGVEGM